MVSLEQVVWLEAELTSEAGAEPVVVAVQQSVQDAGEDGDVVFAVIGQRLSMSRHCTAMTKRLNITHRHIIYYF